MSDLILSELQADIAARLSADEVCGRVRIVTERKADVVGEITTAIASANAKGGVKGLALVVLQIVGDDSAPEYPVPVLELRPAVRVLENPAMNTAKDLDALTLAYRVALLFKLWNCEGKTSPFSPDAPNIVGVEDPIAPLAYDVRWVTFQRNVQNNRKVATPVITPDSGASPQTAAIVCATPGAAIWYTMDDRYPVPGAAGSTKYTEPVEVPAALNLRAVAYLPDFIASDAAEATYD